VDHITVNGLVMESWIKQIQVSRATTIGPVKSHNYLNE
jgi:hypothetical protein